MMQKIRPQNENRPRPDGARSPGNFIKRDLVSLFDCGEWDLTRGTRFYRCRARPIPTVPDGATYMRRRFLSGVIMASALFTAAFTAAPARADEWSKSYTISGRANLRVGTDDGDVNIISADQNQIDAHITAEGYKIAPSEVRIEEHQEGDHVTLEVKL